MSMSSFRRYHHHNRGGGGSSTSNNNSTNDNQSRGQQQRNNNNSTSSTGNSGGGSNNRHHNSYRFGRSWSSRTNNHSHTNHNNNNNNSNHRNGPVNNNRRGILSPTRRATSMREMNHKDGSDSFSSGVGFDGDNTSTSSNSMCVICMEELKGRLGVANPCGHVFHQECYGTWDIQSFGTHDSSDDDDDDDSSNDDFRRHPTKCPTCRRSISVFTHIHELVGQIQFGEIIPPCLQTTTPTSSQNVDSTNGAASSNANRVSPNSSYELSSFIRRNLNDVRGLSTSSLDENEGRASFGVVGDMEVDSLCAEVSDLRSQVASLESILKSSEEQREATAQKVHTDQEHLARGMIDLSESNEQLRTELRKMEGLYETLQIENRRLQDEIEEGKVIMNDLFASKSSPDNHNNYDGDHYGDYHGMHRHSFT